jgi:hypothetical protein
VNGVRETSKLGGIWFICLFWIRLFIWFNFGLVTTRKISIVPKPQIGKSTNGVPEASKFGGTKLIYFIQIGVFTWFNYGLVTTKNISIVWMPQIGKSPSGVGKLQSLVELDQFACFKLGCWSDSIVDLS